jgi:very-short-patch-repair endonuclease
MGVRVIVGKTDLATTHPTLVLEWNYDLNKITPQEISAGSNKKVFWKCPKGHSYASSPSTRLNPCGCSVCSKKVVEVGVNDLLSKSPEIAAEWDQEENGDLKPEMVMFQSNHKVSWKCKNGHQWKASPNTRQKSGCPDCYGKAHFSLREKTVFYYIKKHFHNAVSSYRFKSDRKLEIDIFIPGLNVGIEYDGSYYHQDPIKDQLKTKLIAEEGISLIRIREPKTPEVNDNSTVIQLFDLSVEDLSRAIRELLTLLEDLSHTSLKNVEVTIREDLSDIYSLMEDSVVVGSIASVNPLVAFEWNYKLNYPLTPERVSANSTRILWWTCPVGHDYPASGNNRNNGKRCSYCYGTHSILVGENDLLCQRPKVAALWHPTLNLPLRPDQVRSRSSKKAHWVCEHGIVTYTKIRSKGKSCRCKNKANTFGKF